MNRLTSTTTAYTFLTARNFSVQYSYDATSNRKTMTDPESGPYTDDLVGNRLSSLGVSPYTYNASNWLTSIPGTTYNYDNNGSLTSKSDGTAYNWDFENRLTQVTLPGTGGTVNFKYDPFGRRIQKVFTQGATTTTTNYVYDGANAIEEVDANGVVLARYVQGAGIDEPLAELRSSTTSYYQADGLGSITSLSNAAGALVNTYTYDSFGKLTASTGTVVNPLQFTARDYDSETGLRYYRARYYDSNIGRFVNEDPIQFSAGTNFYGYVLNNPVNLSDPTGLKPKCSPNAVYCICCQGGKLRVCDQSGSAYSGWISDCMRGHEQQHVNDMTCGGKNPCEGQPDGPLLVSSTDKARLECAAYRGELTCLQSAPRDKTIEDRRRYIQTQITSWCGGK